MSTTEAAADERCAFCGIAGGDNIKLKSCTACKLVKYCGVECQRNHRSQHKSACKKRAAELKDELLFKQPESAHNGDCPLCSLPIPIATSQDTIRYTIYPCCHKVVCDGCVYTNIIREREQRLSPKCPFCRRPNPKTIAEAGELEKKRLKANDPLALNNVGMNFFNAGNYAACLEYWERAAGLGWIESHYNLSSVYDEGQGVEKDIKKYIRHMQQAAIGGHPVARLNLGVWEQDKGNIDKAVKHFIIAANLGFDGAIEALKKYYARGMVSKEDFAAALRAYQAAVDATKSPQRDAAEAYSKSVML